MCFREGETCLVCGIDDEIKNTDYVFTCLIRGIDEGKNLNTLKIVNSYSLSKFAMSGSFRIQNRKKKNHN